MLSKVIVDAHSHMIYPHQCGDELDVVDEIIKKEGGEPQGAGGWKS